MLWLVLKKLKPLLKKRLVNKKLASGLFISLEGGEGAGKSTLISAVARELAREGHSIVKTREPGGTHLGEQIRTILLDSESPISPYTELCLFLAARAQQIQEIITPALLEGKIVLCDRFNDSTIAYQGAARGLGVKEVEHFCDFICQGVQPRLTLYLDIDPELGLSRLVRSHDRIESEGMDFHTTIRNAFRARHAKDKNRFHLLDASEEPEIVYAEAMKLIHALLEERE